MTTIMENSMSRLASAAFALAMFALPATSALAQTCLGTASFASGPARIGFGLDFSEDTKQYGAQIAFGKAAGPFAGASVALVDIDEVDDSGTAFELALGYSLSVSGKGSMEICPVAGFGYASVGVDEGGISVDLSERTLSAGFAIGGVASSSPTFKFIPSAMLAYVNANAKSEGFIEFDESEDFGLVSLAAGFVFNDRVTLRPNVAIPVGLDDSDPTYGIGISFNFGRPSAAR